MSRADEFTDAEFERLEFDEAVEWAKTLEEDAKDNPDTGTPYDARPFGNAGGGKGASTGTPKLNANPGPSIAHDFNCTHDPCMCTGTQELREILKAYGFFVLNDKSQDKHVRKKALDNAESEIEALINTRIAAVLDRAEKELLPEFMDISTGASQPEFDKEVFGDKGSDAMRDAMAMRVATMNVLVAHQRKKLSALRKEVSANLTKEKP